MSLREEMAEICEDLLFLGREFDPAIIGFATMAPASVAVAYDREHVIEILMEQGTGDWLEAEEYFQFNIACAYFGPHSPVFIEFVFGGDE